MEFLAKRFSAKFNFELTKNLLDQIKPFKTKFHFNERVQEIKNDKGKWLVKTNKNKSFIAPNVLIAGGVGSFEPRKLPLKELEKFEEKQVFYSVSNKENFKNKKIALEAYKLDPDYITRSVIPGTEEALKEYISSNGTKVPRIYEDLAVAINKDLSLIHI